MRNLLVSAIATCFLVGGLYGHGVTYDPDPMKLSFGGPDGTITVAPVGDEPSPDCEVTASAKPGTNGLVSVTPASPQPGASVVLTVHVLRQPQGPSESVVVSGSWSSAGIPSPPCLTGVTGVIRTLVTVIRAEPTVNAVVNGASFVGGGIVPGEIATIFGANLTASTGINLASSLPLPSAIMNVSVIVNDPPVPMFAVDNVNGQQQINFQVPWEVAGRSTATVGVSNAGTMSAAIAVPVLAAQPGIFAYSAAGGSFGAILHGSFQLVDISHPAVAGETVLIYCTGLGMVASPPGDGAPGNGQNTVATPVVTIGGVSATVSFSGLAPGFVGLNQVNVEVPSGVASGNQAVVVTMSGASSSSVLLPVR